MNICINCIYCLFMPDGENTSKKKNPLDYRCSAIKHDKIVSPVTGEDTFVTHEARFLTDHKHPHCIDMNPIGECVCFNEFTA